MTLIEVDTLGEAIKKTIVYYSLGVATGVFLGYKLFHEKEPEIEHPYKIEIPYKK